MAMITCPKCHRHISSLARTCPECGAPVEPETETETQPQEQTPVTQEPPKKQKKKKRLSRRNLWFMVLVLLLGLIIGGLYFYDYRAEQRREQHAYEILKECSNPDFYEDFIARFPNSKHIDEVRKRLTVVAAQQKEWQNLIASGTKADLQHFAKQHPTSPYAKVALTRIDSLDWVEAKSTRSLEAVTHYMATHPDGYFIDQAETLRQTLERQRAEAAAALRDSLATNDSITSSPAV